MESITAINIQLNTEFKVDEKKTQIYSELLSKESLETHFGLIFDSNAAKTTININIFSCLGEHCKQVEKKRISPTCCSRHIFPMQKKRCSWESNEIAKRRMRTWKRQKRVKSRLNGEKKYEPWNHIKSKIISPS